MKRLTSLANLLVFLALLASVATPQSVLDSKRDNLVGSVRSIQFEFSEANEVNGKLVETKRWPHQRVSYNEKGREVERVNFNEDGTERDRSVIRYDPQGNIMDYGDAQKDRRHSTREYDSKGNLTEVRGYDGDVIQTQMVYTYDDKGRKIEESWIENGGAYNRRLTYAYNAAGQQTEMAAYYSGKLSEKHLKIYNGAGKLVREESIHYELPDEDSTIEYSYDDSGREIETYVDTAILWSRVQRVYDANGRVAQYTTQMEYKKPNVRQTHAPVPGRVTFSYNDRGQVLEQVHYGPDGTLAGKTVFTYDEQGKLIEEAHVSKNVPGDRKVTYEYDSHGNWIKRATPASDNKHQYIYVEYRIITYY